MARSSPQSFEKRQRERRKQQKREEKFERRLIRNDEKKRLKEEGVERPAGPGHPDDMFADRDPRESDDR